MENIVPALLQRVRAADIIHVAGLAAASLGQEYCRAGAVSQTQRQGLRLSGLVDLIHTTGDQTKDDDWDSGGGSADGKHVQRYAITVEMKSATSWTSRCTCNSQHGRLLCSHAAALLYQWLARPAAFIPVSTPSMKTDVEEIKSAPPLQLRKKVDSVVEDEKEAKEIVSPLGAATRPTPGPVPLSDLHNILSQLSLSELRSLARNYDVSIGGLGKMQLVEGIIVELDQPEIVRRIATTLEKAQRQLLAAVALAGGSVTDDDLRGLYERFSLGPASQLQGILLALQGKGLLFRTSLNSAQPQRDAVNGTLLDIGWYVPTSVRTALRVSMPVTPYNIERPDEREPAPIQYLAEPYCLQADLLQIATVLNGYILPAGQDWPEQSVLETEASSRGMRSFDRSAALPPPGDQPAPELVATLQAAFNRPPAFLRFAVRLLRQAGMIYQDDSDNRHVGDNRSIQLLALPGLAELLLGPTRMAVIRDLFDLWLVQSSYGELFELETKSLRLRCSTSSLNLPALRSGELEVENSEARQTIIALLAQAPLQQWINFSSFARFVYRLNPLFLQRRQRLYASPHWWIEQEMGRPLRPLQLSDWLRAEHLYLTSLIDLLHWWGVCDIVRGTENRLLAFRLTPLSGWLLANKEVEGVTQDYIASAGSLKIAGTDDLLIPCTAQMWPAIEVLETFAQPAGIHQDQLCYRLTIKALGDALSKGQRFPALLHLLRSAESGCEDPEQRARFSALLAQVEQWIASFGRVRIYSGVALLEAADAGVMRELTATTSLHEQITLSVAPTIHIVKKAATGRLIDELKRRGQTPLVHDEAYGAE